MQFQLINFWCQSSSISSADQLAYKKGYNFVNIIDVELKLMQKYNFEDWTKIAKKLSILIIHGQYALLPVRLGLYLFSIKICQSRVVPATASLVYFI